MKKLGVVLLFSILTFALFGQISGFSQTGKVTHEMQANGFTMAHGSLPINSKVMVRNNSTGEEIEVTVVERIAASSTRIADISQSVWIVLGLTSNTEVSIYTRSSGAAPIVQPNSVQQVSGPQKFALVIGNAAYTGTPWGRLNNSVNDANSMEKALKELGFTVDVVRDGTKDQMETAVINFRRKLNAARANAYGFFYYAGHGAQHNGENYLIPVNARTSRLEDLEDNTMSVSFVMQELELAKNELNMIVLDACRNLPDALQQAATRGGINPNQTRGLATISKAPPGSIIMFATAANTPAMDGTAGGNGLFTGYLLQNLTTPGLEVDEIFKRTARAVVESTKGSQYPELKLMYYGTAYLGSPPSQR
jgi:hypothetical protein